MPILTVELVAHPDQETPHDLATVIADRAAEVFGTGPGRTWVRLRILPLETYAENGIPRDRLPRPVFVSVLKSDLPPPDQLERECAELAEQIGAACGRPPANVHVIYEAPARGRIAFGGKLLR